jgi:hypothetical protein
MFGLNARRLFYILVVAAAIFVGSQYAPAYFYAFQFDDFIQQEVKYAAASKKTPDDIKRELLDKAPEFHIPITPRDIHITHRGPSFTLDVDYTWPIDLRVYHHDLKFHPSGVGEDFER